MSGVLTRRRRSSSYVPNSNRRSAAVNVAAFSPNGARGRHVSFLHLLSISVTAVLSIAVLFVVGWVHGAAPEAPSSWRV